MCQFGLGRPSFVPSQQFRDLRALSRHRRKLVARHAQVRNQAQKVIRASVGRARRRRPDGTRPRERRLVRRRRHGLAIDIIHAAEYVWKRGLLFHRSAGVIEGVSRYVVRDRIEFTGARWRVLRVPPRIRLLSLRLSAILAACRGTWIWEATIVEKYVAVAPVLHERSRRLWAAAESMAIGYGGDALFSSATGLERETIRRGRCEIARGDESTGRIRTSGRRSSRHRAGPTRHHGGARSAGGPAGTRAPDLAAALDVQENATLTGQGWRVSSTTVGRLLHCLGYRLQSVRKRREGTTHPDCNAQFEHINATADRLAWWRAGDLGRHEEEGTDGPLRQRGREWHPRRTPPAVRLHDCPSDGGGQGDTLRMKLTNLYRITVLGIRSRVLKGPKQCPLTAMTT